MYILGISGSSVGHDPSACLLADGQIIGAIEEERLSREKHRAGIWPIRSIAHLLKYHSVAEEEVDEIAFYWSTRYMWRMMGSTLRYFRPGRILAGLQAIKNKLIISRNFAHGPPIFAGHAFSRRPVPPIRYTEHHIAHAASAHLASPFETSAGAVLDGSGEYACTGLFHWQGPRVRPVGQTNYPDSLGFAYAAVTEYLGFHCLADEWKVMGLAPYGSEDPELRRFFEELIVLLPDGQYRIAPEMAQWVVDYLRDPLFNERAHSRLGGPPRKKGSVPGEREADIAFNFQRRIEETIFHVLRHLQKVTGEKRLTLSGGVALNCKANGKILENTDFEEIWLQPASHDAGASMGAALHAWQIHTGWQGERWRMTHPYLGPEFATEEVRSELAKTKLRFEECADPAATAAELLGRGKIIGWFQGRMEWGPRALGNRSILADPRDASMKDKVNAAIKFREGFRPFAPAILAECATDYFEGITDSPFMTFTSVIRPERRQELGAVCHEDNTGRLQTVERETNPRFHALISRFQQVTGTPVVMNTSFNVKGEPIVCSPQEAIRCFSATGLDALVIDRFLLVKHNLSMDPEPSRIAQRSGAFAS